MAVIFQTTLSNSFSSLKMFEFLLNFHWSLFLRVHLTIAHHWFRWWLGADQATSHYLNQGWKVYWRIYASLGLNELRDFLHHWSFTQQNPMTFAHKGVVITKLWYFTCWDQTINFLACEINFFAFYSPQQGLDWWSKDLLCPFILAYQTQSIEVWHPYNSGMGPHWLR